MAEINIPQAKEQPDNLISPSIDNNISVDKKIKRDIINQSWSMINALKFIDIQQEDLRNIDNLSTAIVDSNIDNIDKSVTGTDLDNLYSESNQRRGNLNLNPVIEDTYKSQRDPKELKSFVLTILKGTGIEDKLSEDYTITDGTNKVLNITDQNVLEIQNLGDQSVIQDKAIKISETLNIINNKNNTDGKNILINDIVDFDSTDEYSKRIL